MDQPFLFCCEFFAGWRGNPVVCWDRQKVTLPKGADPQNKNSWFCMATKNGPLGLNLCLTLDLFCELLVGGVWSMEWCGRHILVMNSLHCSFLQKSGICWDPWFRDILICSQNQHCHFPHLLESFGVQLLWKPLASFSVWLDLRMGGWKLSRDWMQPETRWKLRLELAELSYTYYTFIYI